MGNKDHDRRETWYGKVGNLKGKGLEATALAMDEEGHALTCKKKGRKSSHVTQLAHSGIQIV